MDKKLDLIQPRNRQPQIYLYKLSLALGMFARQDLCYLTFLLPPNSQPVAFGC